MNRRMLTPTPEVTIIMPCLNEAETLADCIAAAQRGIAEEGVDGEILITDNGSTGGSQDIARRLGARVVDVPEKGYGNTIRHGMPYLPSKRNTPSPPH